MMDNFTYNGREGRTRGGEEWEMKLFSHRFHFSNPSLLTLTVTHYKDQVIIYVHKRCLYMSISESEFRDMIHSQDLIKGKIKQCRRVMYGREPPLLDVEDQSSTIPKSNATVKIEKERSRHAKARQAMVLDISEDEEDTDEVPPHKPKKIRHSKTECSASLEVHHSDEDSDGH